MTSQCPGALSGESCSAAPARKSEIVASIGMPSPAIMMPVWPVARNVAAMPRALSARVSASAVYFLPSAQSVPTVSTRLPVRCLPVATGNVPPTWRTSTRRRPARSAARTRRGKLVRRVCMPLTTSRPASSAASRSSSQCSGRLPPVGATPTTSDPAPLAAASRGVRRGRSSVTLPAGCDHSASTASRHQSLRPKAVLQSDFSVASPR